MTTPTELRALLAEALQYIDPASGLAAHKLRALITAALSEKDEGVPLHCRVKAGWVDAGRRGIFFGQVYAQQAWAVVRWDDEDDPETFKSAGIEVIQIGDAEKWQPLPPLPERKV